MPAWAIRLTFSMQPHQPAKRSGGLKQRATTPLGKGQELVPTKAADAIHTPSLPRGDKPGQTRASPSLLSGPILSTSWLEKWSCLEGQPVKHSVLTCRSTPQQEIIGSFVLWLFPGAGSHSMSLDHLKGGCESILISLPRPGTACCCCFTNLKAESLRF